MKVLPPSTNLSFNAFPIKNCQQIIQLTSDKTFIWSRFSLILHDGLQIHTSLSVSFEIECFSPGMKTNEFKCPEDVSITYPVSIAHLHTSTPLTLKSSSLGTLLERAVPLPSRPSISEDLQTHACCRPSCRLGVPHPSSLGPYRQKTFKAEIKNVDLHNNNHTFYQNRFPDQVS